MKSTSLPFALSLSKAWLMLLAGVGSLATAHADLLLDPTRPAPAWLAAQPTAAQPGGAADANGAEASVRVLVIGPARKFAIVDGQVMRYGDTYNGAKLVGIAHDGVVMQREGSRVKLSMSPAVEKKPRVSKPKAANVKSRKIVVNGEGQ